jgi:hypothetical protein
MVEEMSGSKRFIVLEIQDQAGVIKQLVEHLALTAPQLGLKTITQREATNILYFVVRDELDALLEHKLGDPANAEMVMSILWGIPKNKLTKAHTDMFREIKGHSLFQGAVYEIGLQINRYVTVGSWTDWNAVKVGTLIALHEGEDHRITEYHKEAKALSTDDEAVVTVNCCNPINYLYNQFKLRYGGNMAALMAHVQNPMVEIDPFWRKVISDFFADPSEFISGIFCDTLIKVNPQIELAQTAAPRMSGILLKMLNIHDLEKFQSDVVSKLIIAFGLGWLGSSIKKDESYTLEYYRGTNILAIFKKQFTSLTEKYEEDLLRAFIRNDYLPDKERVIAERLYIERPQQVLNLSQ